MSTSDHLHIYNLRGFCWCGARRDDWLRDEDMLEKIGKAFKYLAEDEESSSPQVTPEKK